jgi:hypothetical protein
MPSEKSVTSLQGWDSGRVTGSWYRREHPFEHTDTRTVRNGAMSVSIANDFKGSLSEARGTQMLPSMVFVPESASAAAADTCVDFFFVPTNE